MYWHVGLDARHDGKGVSVTLPSGGRVSLSVRDLSAGPEELECTLSREAYSTSYGHLEHQPTLTFVRPLSTATELLTLLTLGEQPSGQERIDDWLTTCRRIAGQPGDGAAHRQSHLPAHQTTTRL
jgi:hypothetical protein